MSNADRIQKFFDDQTHVLTAKDSSSKTSKISSEVSSLRKWVVGHQDVAVPDGSKSKLVSIMERYNRAAGYYAPIRSVVQSLFEDFLQLPEGKLVNSKGKAQVLSWLQSFVDHDEATPAPSEAKSHSTWTVEAVNAARGCVTLLNSDDAELWKEDWAVSAEHLDSIRSLYDLGNTVTVIIDDSSDSILQIG